MGLAVDDPLLVWLSDGAHQWETVRLPWRRYVSRHPTRGLVKGESRRLGLLRFDCSHQYPGRSEIRSSTLTTHSMTCQILYLAFPTTLPRRIDDRALCTDGNARSRSRSHGLHPRPGRTHSGCLSTSSLGVRLWSVNSWKPAQILATDARIAGWAGETRHGTLFVRSIVEVTNGLNGCTGSGLVDRRTGGGDDGVLSDAGRRLEADDV